MIFSGLGSARFDRDCDCDSDCTERTQTDSQTAQSTQLEWPTTREPRAQMAQFPSAAATNWNALELELELELANSSQLSSSPN